VSGFDPDPVLYDLTWSPVLQFGFGNFPGLECLALMLLSKRENVCIEYFGLAWRIRGPAPRRPSESFAYISDRIVSGQLRLIFAERLAPAPQFKRCSCAYLQ
jgi:hypothetical protein